MVIRILFWALLLLFVLLQLYLLLYPLLLLLLEECKQHLFNFWRDSRLICICPLHFMLFDLPRCMMRGKGRQAATCKWRRGTWGISQTQLRACLHAQKRKLHFGLSENRWRGAGVEQGHHEVGWTETWKLSLTVVTFNLNCNLISAIFFGLYWTGFPAVFLAAFPAVSLAVFSRHMLKNTWSAFGNCDGIKKCIWNESQIFVVDSSKIRARLI